MRLCFPNFPDCVCKTMFGASFGQLMDVANLNQASMLLRQQCLLERRNALSLSFSSVRSHAILKVTSNAAAAAAHVYLKNNSSESHKLSDQAFLYGEDEEEEEDDDEFSIDESQRKILRRERIGLANKGKIPWNKGITHNEATRLKIKQRTIEALSNPKVRKRMSECYRDRSEQCKAKISVSLRHVWAKRLNYPRQREEFYLSWFESIALAAKKGGKDQKELGWDSYAKMTDELVRQKHEQESHEVKAKIKPALRGKKITNSKIVEFSAVGQNECGNVMEDQPKKKRKRKKCSKRDIDEEIMVSDDSNLQTRLSKIKKPTTVTIKAETNSSFAWEKLDLDYANNKNRLKVSLADQIQAAKNEREKLMSNSPCGE